jgi:hypothetical protein
VLQLHPGAQGLVEGVAVEAGEQSGQRAGARDAPGQADPLAQGRVESGGEAYDAGPG